MIQYFSTIVFFLFLLLSLFFEGKRSKFVTGLIQENYKLRLEIIELKHGKFIEREDM